MILILKICLLFAGLLLPCLCGYSVLKLFGFDRHTSKRERFILSFLFGWMMFSAIFAIAGFADFGFNVLGGIIIIVLFWGIFYYISRGRNISCAENTEILFEKDVPESATKKEPLANKIFKYTLIILSAILFASMFIESAGDTDSMPMNAVWGYKAMFFYKEGMIPVSFFTDPNMPFTHQSYPLCYPVMLTWSYMCMEGVHEPLIKLIPSFLGLLVFLSLYTICRKENVSQIKSLIIALLFCGCASFNLSSTILYAENLMILYVMWGVYFLYRYLEKKVSVFSFQVSGEQPDLMQCTTGDGYTTKEEGRLLLSGFLLLAGGAWVKSEGLRDFGLAAGFIIIANSVSIVLKKFAKYASFKSSDNACTIEEGCSTKTSSKSLNKKCTSGDAYTTEGRKSVFITILIIVIPALLFIVPWQLFRYYLDVPVRDFEVMAKINTIVQAEMPVLQSPGQILKKSIMEFLYVMFVDVKSNCGVWYFMILSLFMFKKRVFCKENLFLFWMICLPITIFAISFIFSTRPLGWHMDATPRLLLIPASVAWIVIAVIFSSSINTCPQKNK